MKEYSSLTITNFTAFYESLATSIRNAFMEIEVNYPIEKFIKKIEYFIQDAAKYVIKRAGDKDTNPDIIFNEAIKSIQPVLKDYATNCINYMENFVNSRITDALKEVLLYNHKYIDYDIIIDSVSKLIEDSLKENIIDYQLNITKSIDRAIHDMLMEVVFPGKDLSILFFTNYSLLSKPFVDESIEFPNYFKDYILDCIKSRIEIFMDKIMINSQKYIEDFPVLIPATIHEMRKFIKKYKIFVIT